MSLKHAILGFLSYMPLSGYDLKRAFDKSVRHFWPANQSQIYRTLAEMDEAGWVEKEVIEREERLDMKIYRITETGLTELRRWLSTPLPTQEDRVPFLIQVFFAGQLTDAELLNVLRRELASIEERLAVYSAIYQETTGQPARITAPRAVFLSTLTLEYGLASSYAYIKWLKNAIRRIQAGDFTPAGISELRGEYL